MMPRLEQLANVALRVPSILVLDMLYKCDIDGLTEHLRAKNEDMLFKYKYVIWNMYYLGHVINVVVLVLPLRHIVTLYLHVLAALLLYVGHQISKDYVHEEVQFGYEGALYLDSLAFNRFVSALTSQIILSTLCAFLMKTRKVWLFSAHTLPLLARMCTAPHTMLLVVNFFSLGLTTVGIVVFLLSNLFVPYRLAKAAYSELLQLEVIELYRLLAVAISLWNQFAVPVLFSVFWLVLFVVQLGSDIMAGSHASAGLQGIMFTLLTSVSECCSTPYSLLGLTFVVSYLALGLLNLCKFYLGGYAAVQNENIMHRGVTEGVTLLLLALQTGLLDMQALQRTFLLTIILFIVVTSTLQSMIEITDPIILALGASRNRSLWKHLRGLSMCLLLLLFPGFMAYRIAQFFHMDFWLLILVSSCMLTSLQVTGTMLIYSLFMVELFRTEPIDSLDEVIYWVNAVSRVLEFVVALCVVAYGTWESLFGEWSWMGASVIIVHSYFNVWLRAQTGWKSFLLRQEAAKKINSLPRATPLQLQRHNDVCSICFQEMSSAVITHCGHFFHGNCLRKWLYVQETCPMCHQAIGPAPPGQSEGAGDAPAEPPQRETGGDPAAEQRDQTPGAHPANQANPANPADPANQANPADPANQANQANQADTANTANPADPANPADTADQADPANPANQANLADPANPADPANQANPGASGTTEQQEGTEDGAGEGPHGAGHDDSPGDLQAKSVQGLRFSSSGDFVGFVSPEPSCSSGDSSSLCESWDQPSPVDSLGAESSDGQAGGDPVHSGAVESRTKGSSPPSPSNADLITGDNVESRCDSERAGRHAMLEGLTASSGSTLRQSDSECEESNAFVVVTKLDSVISRESHNSIKRERADAPYENGTEEPPLEEAPESQMKKSGAPNTDRRTTDDDAAATSRRAVDSVDGNATDRVPDADSCREHLAGRIPIEPSSSERTEHSDDDVDRLRVHYQKGELTDTDLDPGGPEEAKPANPPPVAWSSTGAMYSCTNTEEE